MSLWFCLFAGMIVDGGKEIGKVPDYLLMYTILYERRQIKLNVRVNLSMWDRSKKEMLWFQGTGIADVVWP